jgi:hypothetical protein
MCSKLVDGSVLEGSVYLVKLADHTHGIACPDVGCKPENPVDLS